MSDKTTGKVAVGEIVGYRKPWIPFGKKVKVLVRVDGETVTVRVDHRQLRFIEEKYAAGRRVAVGFYGGEWHIGSPPAIVFEFSPRQNIAEIDLLGREIEGIDLPELVTRPSPEAEAAPGRQADESPTAIPEEVDEYLDYIRQVEQTIKDGSDELLRSFGLSHLAAIKEKQNEDIKKLRKAKPRPAGSHYLALLDSIIAQNREIIFNQKAMIRLLRMYPGFFNESKAKLN
ncbi:MAG TPA: hypothetical protein VMC61_06365 [Methanocella sp.]|nr:hypothetical protein [Methanocella sp.]